jgi:hypothetical protein
LHGNIPTHKRNRSAKSEKNWIIPENDRILSVKIRDFSYAILGTIPIEKQIGETYIELGFEVLV